MECIAQSAARRQRLALPVALSIPLAIGALVATQGLHMELLDVVAACGLLVAVVGGTTKIGSP